MKIFILQCSNDLFYMEEFYYNTYQERYQKTKGIDPMKIYEVGELDSAYKKVAELNIL